MRPATATAHGLGLVVPVSVPGLWRLVPRYLADPLGPSPFAGLIFPTYFHGFGGSFVPGQPLSGLKERRESFVT